jgi:hypothetical protein
MGGRRGPGAAGVAYGCAGAGAPRQVKLPSLLRPSFSPSSLCMLQCPPPFPFPSRHPRRGARDPARGNRAAAGLERFPRHLPRAAARAALLSERACGAQRRGGARDRLWQRPRGDDAPGAPLPAGGAIVWWGAVAQGRNVLPLLRHFPPAMRGAALARLRGGGPRASDAAVGSYRALLGGGPAQCRGTDDAPA